MSRGTKRGGTVITEMKDKSRCTKLVQRLFRTNCIIHKDQISVEGSENSTRLLFEEDNPITVVQPVMEGAI